MRSRETRRGISSGIARVTCRWDTFDRASKLTRRGECQMDDLVVGNEHEVINVHARTLLFDACNARVIVMHN